MGPNGLPDFVSDCIVSDMVFVWDANSFQSISSPWPAVSSGCPRSMTRFRRRTRVPRQSGSPWVSMSLIFELREIFLSFQITQMVFSFDRAAVILCNSGQYFRLRTLICDDCAHTLKTVHLVQFFAVDSDVNAYAIFYSWSVRSSFQAIHQRG